MLIEGWFDGACEPVNPGGHATWGALVKVNGDIVYAKGGYCGCGPQISNNVAEYSAFCEVARECSKYSGVCIIRGDSKLVIMQLQGKWRVRGGLYKPFYDQAAIAWNRLKDRATLQWVPREQNGECDALSKKVFKERGIKMKIQPESF